MSIKTKLISLVMTFVLLTSLLTVGVFAVKNTSFNVGGNIVFNAQGIEAEVKLEALNNGSLIAPQTLANKMLTFELNNDMTESQVLACYESWAGLDLQFDSEEDVTLQIRITNTTGIADNYIKVDLSTTQGTPNNCSVTVDKTSIKIAPGTHEIFTITFSIEDPDYSASLSGFAVNINMAKTEPLVKYDSENNYYYLEMGTYGGKPVRWRYVSDVTNGIDTAARFAPTAENAPVSTAGSKGMFILESDIFTADTLINGIVNGGVATLDNNDGIIEFLPSNMYAISNSKYYHTTAGYTDVYANDYAASNLRAFLTGRTNVAGQDVGNLMNVIGIDSTNAIYQKIQGRTLTELYSKNNQDGTAQTLPTQFEGSATDMFWSLSDNEALQILGGGEAMQNELIWRSLAYAEFIGILDEEDRPVDEEEYWNAFYWLRSPCLHSKYACYVDLVGGIDGNFNNVETPSFAARPAFILVF